jgi:hypothetical protein
MTQSTDRARLRDLADTVRVIQADTRAVLFVMVRPGEQELAPRPINVVLKW